MSESELDSLCAKIGCSRAALSLILNSGIQCSVEYRATADIAFDQAVRFYVVRGAPSLTGTHHTANADITGEVLSILRGIDSNFMTNNGEHHV